MPEAENTPLPEPPLPLWLRAYGWYGTLAILVAYFLNSHEWMDRGVGYQLLNVSGSIGVGLVCLRKRAWSPMALEFVWAAIGVSALLKLAIG